MRAHTRLSISQSVNSKRLQTTAALKKIISKVMEKYKLLHINIHSKKRKKLRKHTPTQIPDTCTILVIKLVGKKKKMTN